ncbi:MAG: energy transducer TonB [Planctomycetes bacterium]|nr:energy transducer TonB [Planctomycetota bacterium]
MVHLSSKSNFIRAGALAASLVAHAGVGVICYFTTVPSPRATEIWSPEPSRVISAKLAEPGRGELAPIRRELFPPEIDVQPDLDPPDEVPEPSLADLKLEEPPRVDTPRPRPMEDRSVPEIHLVRIKRIPRPQTHDPPSKDKPDPISSADSSSTVVSSPEGAENPPPSYPRLARRMGYEGLVIVTVRVSTQGQCIAVRVKTSSGHDILDKAAVVAVRAWMFRPGSVNGIAVEAELDIPIRFHLTE